MKFPFFRSLAIAGALVVAWNCSDENVANVEQQLEQAFVDHGTADPTEMPTRWVIHGDVTYVIYPSNGVFAVVNAEGTPVGTYDAATATIVTPANEVIATGIILSNYSQILPDGSVHNPDGSVFDKDGNMISGPTNIDPVVESSSTGNTTPDVTPTSATTNPDVKQSSSSVQKDNPQQSSSSAQKDDPKPQSSSSSKSQPTNIGSITVEGSLEQNVQKNGSISTVVFKNVSGEPQREWNIYFVNGKYDQNAKTYTLTGTVPDYLSDGTTLSDKYTFSEGSVTFKLTVGSGSAQPKSSSSVKSSSSQQQQQPKSSSSVKSSSSQQQQQQSSSQGSGQTDAEASKYVDAGNGGQGGWATRYWDCCMPSCGWNENAGGNPTKTCDAKGKSPIGSGSGSICSGGQGTTCTSQVPIIASDKVAYAFAAVPASAGGQCGKCFALTFTGKGKYETKANHQALKGKTLVVMASNIGGDVNPGQFDVMIPGGGFGAFNGCGQMGWNIPSNTTQYGGLLSDCEKEVGYDGDLLSLRKECLTKKCNSAFANDSEAKQGCLFLATWMEAAGNPEHTYKEVTCPQALKSKW